MGNRMNETMNLCFIAVYATNGTPDRVSAFVSNTNNDMLELKVWENVDFNDEDSIHKIEGELYALLDKYDAMPFAIQYLFDVENCNKCKKPASVMMWVEGDEATLVYACFACKSVGVPLR